MGYLTERVSYLRGLVDGINLDKNTPESRIFDEIIELLDDIATSVEGLDEKQNELEEEIAVAQDDIVDLNDYVDTLDPDYDPEDDEDDDEFEDVEEEEYYDEFECPNCGEILPIDEALLESDEDITLTCPGCGEVVTISFEDEDDDAECTGDCENCPSAKDEY